MLRVPPRPAPALRRRCGLPEAETGDAYDYMQIYDTREMALAAVHRDGLALEYAAAPLTADREIVLAAVQQDGRALEHLTR